MPDPLSKHSHTQSTVHAGPIEGMQAAGREAASRIVSNTHDLTDEIVDNYLAQKFVDGLHYAYSKPKEFLLAAWGLICYAAGRAQKIGSKVLNKLDVTAGVALTGIVIVTTAGVLVIYHGGAFLYRTGRHIGEAAFKENEDSVLVDLELSSDDTSPDNGSTPSDDVLGCNDAIDLSSPASAKKTGTPLFIYLALSPKKSDTPKCLTRNVDELEKPKRRATPRPE